MAAIQNPIYLAAPLPCTTTYPTPPPSLFIGRLTLTRPETNKAAPYCPLFANEEGEVSQFPTKLVFGYPPVYPLLAGG